MKKLLITGFDPFGGEAVNPAFEAVRLLPDEIAGFELCKLEIPTEFIRSGVILKDAIRTQSGAKLPHASASDRPEAARPSRRSAWRST